jgi:predicted membrane metal-binding protein
MQWVKETSVLVGILLGVQSSIPQGVQEAFRLTGTSYIIVILGFNITIIAGLFTLLFSRLLGERTGAIVAAIGIIFYTFLVGTNAAVVRAAFLGMLTLLGHQLGRAGFCFCRSSPAWLMNISALPLRISIRPSCAGWFARTWRCNI